MGIFPQMILLISFHYPNRNAVIKTTQIFKINNLMALKKHFFE